MVKPKKHLGQHFLKDKNIATKIVDSLTGHGQYNELIEIGPGTGVLTNILKDKDYSLCVSEVDIESIAYLIENGIVRKEQVKGDFLREDLRSFDKLGVIGNFPYNISSQLFFRILQEKDKVMEVVCMIQKEVALRIASKEGNKVYGILSVLLQAFYDIEVLFHVSEKVFIPPPKVQSTVIRLKRNDVRHLDCDEKLFFKVVKQGFQNRRKTLRNALKVLSLSADINSSELLSKRAEQLSVKQFIELTKLIQNTLN